MMKDVLTHVQSKVGSKVYLVGGCVRDSLMGIEPKDVDLVTLTTPDELTRRGWEATGESFPVFRHPDLGSAVQLALGRGERKVAAGHKGFEWYLARTLTEDLLRRDLTMNAIAMDSGGNIIDPFNGRNDIKDKVLRPVSEAFAEDPLRVFRAAKFAARYKMYPSGRLLAAMRTIGDLSALSHERVRNEMVEALGYDSPNLFFDLLREGNCLSYWFPEIAAGLDVPAGPAHAHGDTSVYEHLMLAAKATPAELEVRLMALVHDFGKALTAKELLPHHYGHENVTDPVTTFSRRFNFNETLERKLVSHTKMHMRYHLAREMRPAKLVRLYRSVRRYKDQYLTACLADSRGRVGKEMHPEDPFLSQLFSRLDMVDLSMCKNEDQVVKLLEKEANKFKKEV